MTSVVEWIIYLEHVFRTVNKKGRCIRIYRQIRIFIKVCDRIGMLHLITIEL